MRNSKLAYFFAGALVATISSLATHTLDARASQKAGRKSTSHVLLSPEDYIEIQQLYAMYARDVDPGSVRDASWMFTRDAVAMISGQKPLTTPEEFKKFYQNSGTPRQRAAASATSTRPSSSSACPTGPPAARRTWWASRRRRRAAARRFSCSGSTKTSS